MSRQDGIYVQGAYITRDDFEPLKTIKYFCELYNIKLTKEMDAEITSDNLSEETLDYLIEKLEIKDPVCCTQDICNGVLTHMELLDMFAETGERVLIGNKMVAGDAFKNIQGYFEPADEDKPMEFVEGEYLMLGFYVPFVWSINPEEIPKSKEDAISSLRDAGKKFLKDNINWEERLGALKASYIEEYL